MGKYDLEYFKSQDDPKNSYLKAIGLDNDGHIVWEKYGCDKRDCNCMGSWSNGETDQIKTYISRPDM